jgi:hypothetical protein
MARDAARGGLASTRQHALTAYTLGVKQVICAVNKVCPVYRSPTARPLCSPLLLTQQRSPSLGVRRTPSCPSFFSYMGCESTALAGFN